MFIIKNEEERLRCMDAIRYMPLYPVQQVKIGDYKRNRTLEQNSAFHAWCKSIADYNGDDFETIKYGLVHNVFGLSTHITNQLHDGKIVQVEIPYLRSTTDLTVEEFCRLQDATLALAHFLNVRLQPYGGTT